MTHGERWLEKTVARMQGYCRARAWRMSAVVKVGAQYQFDVYDSRGNAGEIAFEMQVDQCVLIDDYGRDIDYLDAKLFEATLPNLERPRKPDRRQLGLALC